MNSDEHNKRIIRLLKNDADRRDYIRNYMKKYRENKKIETGKAQKHYYDLEDIKKRSKVRYQMKTVLNDIRFLFLQ